MNYFYFFLLLFSANAFSQTTDYEPERIIWNGVEHPYRYHHLEQYFNYYPEKRPVVNTDSTIINRNYVAVFEVKDQKFYLNDLFIAKNGQKTKNRSVMYKLNAKKEPMFLNWISGLYDIGMGEEQFLKNDTLNPYYNNYIVFEVSKGQIGRVEHFTYNEMKRFKDYQHKRFKETEKYRTLTQQLIQNGMSSAEVQAHIYQFILFYSKTNFLRK